ncbi:hypothetical protein R1flu_028892 [Riccia fluitans]|uniref:Gag protein n=1 Tax=Riccia fluitans TaxID=41844 RepID=A0ABD1XNH8_9MARC
MEGGTSSPLQQHDPLGAGLAGSENSDDQNSSASLPEGQRFNTVPPVMYASALGQGGIFFYTPSKATSLPGTTVPTVPLFPMSTMGTPTFSFGAGTYPPRTTHPGTTGGPTPIPPLFTMPPVCSRPVTRSMKRRAAASPPKASQPSAAPFVPLRTMTVAASLPGYHPWPHVYPGTGVIGSPGMAPVTPVSGFPAMTFPTIPTPLPTIGEGGGGGSGGRGFGPNSLPVPRQDFTQAVNAAQSVNRFKGDGVTKPDHHLKNFEAVMQAIGILDQALWITVFKTTLVDEATNFADDLDEEGVTKWTELKEEFITRMEAKWLPPEEANSPMVASLFLRNMQSNISDPYCLQFQPRNCTMVQLYQGAQEIQKRFDWKGTPAIRYNRRQKNPETPAGAVGKVAMTKTTAPSFAIFAIATPMAPEIIDLRADEPAVKAVESRTPQIVPAVPFYFFCHKSGHTFHQGCPEYAQKFAGYRNQRGQAGQNGNGVRPAPGCKALTPVLEDSEYNQSGPLEDDKKGVGDTPEVEKGVPEASVAPIGRILQPEPDQEQASSARQTKQERVAAEVDHMHEIIFRQIKDAKISLTIDEITALSPVSKEFVVSRLAGELVPQQRLIRPHPSLNQREQSRALAALRVSHPRREPRWIRIRLGYHRMAPPTTKLAMADNTLVWPLGVLSAVSVVVEGVRLIVSFQVGINLTTMKWSDVATPGTIQVQQAQPVEWNFAEGFTDEDENQFFDDQPYIVPVAEIDKTPAEQAVQGKDIIHKTGPGTNQSVEVDVGTEDQPKVIRIGATLSPQERQ